MRCKQTTLRIFLFIESDAFSTRVIMFVEVHDLPHDYTW